MEIAGINYQWADISFTVYDKKKLTLIALLKSKGGSLVYSDGDLPVAYLHDRPISLHPKTWEEIMKIDRKTYYYWLDNKS